MVRIRRNIHRAPANTAAEVSSAAPPKHVRLATAYVEARGLSPEQARRAGVEPVANASDICGKFKVAALVIPYFDPMTGEPVVDMPGGIPRPFCRLRYLEPTSSAGFSGPVKKQQRYAQPGGTPVCAYFAPGVAVDWPAVLSSAQTPILITEGEIKGLCGCLHGFPTIALGGVWNFRRDGVLLPELEQLAWDGRLVAIVFDSDLANKPEVRAAERRLCAELTQRGAKVQLARLPSIPGVDKTGLDDYLLARGAEALRELLENTPVVDPGPALILEGTDVEIADSVLIDLAEKYQSSVVYCEGSFYAYEGTRWLALADELIKNAIFRYDKTKFKDRATGIVKLNKSRADSILSIMRDRVTDDTFFASPAAGINCATGFIAFDDNGAPWLEPHDPEHHQRHCLDASWHPGATWRGAPLLRTLLTGSLGGGPDGDDKINLVGELCGVAAMGYATRLTSPKAFILHGQRAENGKSEVLTIMRGLLPQDAVCSIPPTHFGDDRMLIKLAGKLLNTSDELGTAKAIKSDTFKSIVTGNTITARDVYRPAVSFRPVALNAFATNVLPPFQGGIDRGVQRRLCVLQFDRSVPKEEQIAQIGERIVDKEGDPLLAFAVEGASRVVRNGGYTEPQSSREALEQWIFDADPVRAWMAECTEFHKDHRQPVGEFYDDFRSWMDREGHRSDRVPSSGTFANRVYAADDRVGKGPRTKLQRFFVGLRLLRGGRTAVGSVPEHSQVAGNVIPMRPFQGQPGDGG